MAGALHIEKAGAACPVTARGNHGRAIFKDDADRRRYPVARREACEKTGWRIRRCLGPWAITPTSGGGREK